MNFSKDSHVILLLSQLFRLPFSHQNYRLLMLRMQGLNLQALIFYSHYHGYHRCVTGIDVNSNIKAAYFFLNYLVKVDFERTLACTSDMSVTGTITTT